MTGQPSAPALPPGTVAVVGPTASGKSALALALARARPGTELVSVDSMQVYRGMDVGTAKPSRREQAEVPHHLIDLVDPEQEFGLADFQRAGSAALADVGRRGARAVLVGGTGLYLRALVDALQIPGQYPEVRAELDAEPDTLVLHRQLVGLDPVAAARMEPTNRRRVLRALEVTIGAGRPFSSFGPGLEAYAAVPCLLVGVRVPRPELDERIGRRLEAQLADGFVEEVRALDERPEGISRTAAQALGYRELLAHVRGECSLDAAIELATVRTRQFARRQERWFRRDPRIVWIDAGAGQNPFDALDHLMRGLGEGSST